MVVVVLVWGCDGDESSENPSTDTSGSQADTLGEDTLTQVDTNVSTPDTTTTEDTDPKDTEDSTDTATPPPNPDCDPLVPDVCALPWPSNLYLKEDAARATGYTLTFGPTTLPVNNQGKHIDPAPFTRMDGYGLGSAAMVLFPEVDISALASEQNIAPSIEDDALIWWVKLDAAGQIAARIPYWVELDAQNSDAAKKILFIRPAVILEESAHYAIIIRKGLQDTSGVPFQPSDAFAALVAGDTGADPLLAPRQAPFNALFSAIEAEGVQRADLLLAWDFATASSDALHGRMLEIVDKGFVAAGDDGPALTVTKVEASQEGDRDFADTAYRIEGTFEAPHFMQTFALSADAQAWIFNLDASGALTQTGTRTVVWRARIPHSALTGTPQSLIHYGHGLLGTSEEVSASWSEYNAKIGNTYNAIHFGADLIGMSESDYGNVATVLSDFSNFAVVSDRLHQGMLEWLLLSRAMTRRFDEVASQISQVLGTPLNLVHDGELFYSGISQGGIFGATFVALSQDITRAHLGVPGNNYSTLLHRSTDFTVFFQLLQLYYRSTTDQAIALSVIQLLWDTSDSISYYRRLKADPLPNRPPHDVLLAPAKGDWQVAVVTNEVVARTDIGIALMENYDVSRTVWGVTPQPYTSEGFGGSGLVLYDFGNPWPAPGNHPPDNDGECSQDQGEVCDPHSKPRRHDPHSQQMIEFFRTGRIIDVCGGDGCTPD